MKNPNFCLLTDFTIFSYYKLEQNNMLYRGSKFVNMTGLNIQILLLKGPINMINVYLFDITPIDLVKWCKLIVHWPKNHIWG